MKPVNAKRKATAKQKLAASKSVGAKSKRRLGLNSAKKIDAEWFYTLGDVETVVAAVLAELDGDPGAGITLDASDEGIVLNVTTSDGDEYTVDVDMDVEGDEAAGEGDEGDEGDE